LITIIQFQLISRYRFVLAKIMIILKRVWALTALLTKTNTGKWSFAGSNWAAITGRGGGSTWTRGGAKLCFRRGPLGHRRPLRERHSRQPWPRLVLRSRNQTVSYCSRYAGGESATSNITKYLRFKIKYLALFVRNQIIHAWSHWRSSRGISGIPQRCLRFTKMT
jgi:hypothetical protein